MFPSAARKHAHSLTKKFTHTRTAMANLGGPAPRNFANGQSVLRERIQRFVSCDSDVMGSGRGDIDDVPIPVVFIADKHHIDVENIWGHIVKGEKEKITMVNDEVSGAGSFR